MVAREEVANPCCTLAELWLDSLVAVCAWLTARLPSGLTAMLLNLQQVVRLGGEPDAMGGQQKGKSNNGDINRKVYFLVGSNNLIFGIVVDILADQH